MRPKSQLFRDTAAAALCYAAITALLFHNLLPVITTHLYSDLGDPLLNCAILAWNATHIPLSPEWWNFASFAPLSGVTAFTEHLLGAYPLTSPIVWATGNAVLAYNVLLLLCFPLNGMAAYALARESTGSAPAAFVAGLAFAFAPYQADHLSHVQMLMAFGMPLALFGLHRYMKAGRASSLAWFAAGWLSVVLSNAYLLVFFPIIAALWMLWFLRGTPWRRFASLGVVTVLATLPVLPLLQGYRVRQTAYGFLRGYDEIRRMSADITGLIGISPWTLLWKGWLPNTFYESSLFPGFAILALAGLGVASHLRQTGSRSPWSSWLLRVAAVLTLVVLARVWTGPAGWHVSAIPLPPFSPFRFGSLPALLFVAGIALTPRFRAALARRDDVVFYFVAAVLMWLFALGPEPAWSGARALAYGPYWLLLHIPGAQGIRVPARAWLPATLCLAICAGAGVARLLRDTPTRRWLIVPIALIVLAEGWFYEGTVRAPTPMLKGSIPAGAVVLDLPVGDSYENADPQYLAVLGGYRVVNGYSGYFPPHMDSLRLALADHRSAAFDRLRRLADLYVIVRPDVDPPSVLWLETQDGAAHVSDDSAWKLYRLPRSNTDPLPPMPLPLPRPGQAPFAID